MPSIGLCDQKIVLIMGLMSMCRVQGLELMCQIDRSVVDYMRFVICNSM